MFLNFHKLFFANACSGRGFVGGKCLQNHALHTALPNRKGRWIIFTPILNPIQSYTECHSVVYWILFSRILNYPHFRRCSGRGWTVTVWWLETDAFGIWNVVTKWNKKLIGDLKNIVIPCYFNSSLSIGLLKCWIDYGWEHRIKLLHN